MADGTTAQEEEGVFGDVSQGGFGGVATKPTKKQKAAGGVFEDTSDTKPIPETKKAAEAAGTVPPKDDTTAKKKPKSSTSDTQKALEAIQTYLTSQIAQGEEAMGEEGQQLAQENAAVTGTTDQFLTGTNSGSAAVNAAQAAYAKAYSAGEGLNSAAYANMGAANAEYLQAAPEQPVVNLLTQGLGSTQYKTLPASLVDQLPQSVRDALAAAGVSVAPASGGEGTPISTAKTVPGSSASTNLLNGTENLGATSVANPSSEIAAITNPATPGA